MQRSVVDTKRMLWLILFGLLLVLCIFQLWWRFEKKNSFAKDLPLLNTAYPFIGNGLLFFGKTEHDSSKCLHSLTSAEHKLTRSYLGTHLVIGTADPEIAQRILTDPVWLDKSYIHDFLELPTGLDTAKYDTWKFHRKALNPAFNKKKLHTFIPIFAQNSRRLVEKLATYSEGSTIDIMDDVCKYTLETVLQTTFGLDCETAERFNFIGKKIVRFFFLISKRVMNAFHYVDIIYRYSADGREHSILRKELDQWAEKILAIVARRLEATGPESLSDDENDNKPKIFIDSMYTSKILKFSPSEIAEEVATIVAAGMDTSSSTIAYCLLSLGMNPDIQQKVYEEAIRVFPSEETEFTPESLRQLEYLNMVINETLRLYPVVHQIWRQNTADSIVDGLNIPMGNVILIDVFNLHRRKDLYGEDADKFNPERFSPERVKDPFAFLAFSRGSRDCIGVRYAYMIMKIMIVRVVKSYIVETNLKTKDLRFKLDLVLRLQDGHLVKLKKRMAI